MKEQQNNNSFDVKMDGVTLENLEAQRDAFGNILEVFNHATIPAILADKVTASRGFCNNGIAVMNNTIEALKKPKKKIKAKSPAKKIRKKPAKKKAKKVVKKKAGKKKLRSVK